MRKILADTEVPTGSAPKEYVPSPVFIATEVYYSKGVSERWILRQKPFTY